MTPSVVRRYHLQRFPFSPKLLAFPFRSFPFTPSPYYNPNTYSLMAEHLDSVNGAKICSVRDAKEFTGLKKNTA